MSENAKLGNGSTIWHFSHIRENVEIGDGCIIHDNVSIYPNSVIGKNCIINAFSSIGTEGLGQEFDSMTDSYVKFPQIGGVKIGDNVEIGQ